MKPGDTVITSEGKEGIVWSIHYDIHLSTDVRVGFNIGSDQSTFKHYRQDELKIVKRKNMTHKEAVTKIADIIEANPGCQLNIDNDCWDITVEGSEEFLCKSSDFEGILSNWYSYGSNYGALLADALIELLDRKGVKVTASSV